MSIIYLCCDPMERYFTEAADKYQAIHVQDKQRGERKIVS